MVEVARHPEHAAVWAGAGRGERVDWRSFFAGYAAAVDWPAAAFWRELTSTFPLARIILTVRDSAAWYASFHATIVERSAGPGTAERLAAARDLRPHARADLGRRVRRPCRRRGPRARRLRRAHQHRLRFGAAGTPARLRRRGRLGTALRVSRAADPERAVSAPEHALRVFCATISAAVRAAASLALSDQP